MVRRFIHLRSHILKGLRSTYRTSDLKAPTYKYRDASRWSGLYGPTSMFSTYKRLSAGLQLKTSQDSINKPLSQASCQALTDCLVLSAVHFCRGHAQQRG